VICCKSCQTQVDAQHKILRNCYVVCRSYHKLAIIAFSNLL